MRLRILLAVVLLFTFSACEDSMILKSEKKMKEDIQGQWLRNFQGRTISMVNCPSSGDSATIREVWTFADNKLYTTFEYDPPLKCDRGTVDGNIDDDVDTVVISQFKIDTKITKAFLKFQFISGTTDSVVDFPDKWEFVTLDSKVLYLATDNAQNTSVLQLEFSKIK